MVEMTTTVEILESSGDFCQFLVQKDELWDGVATLHIWWWWPWFFVRWKWISRMSYGSYCLLFTFCLFFFNCIENLMNKFSKWFMGLDWLFRNFSWIMNNVGSRSENSMSMSRKMKGGDGVGGISHRGSWKKFRTLTCRYLISHVS